MLPHIGETAAEFRRAIALAFDGPMPRETIEALEALERRERDGGSILPGAISMTEGVAFQRPYHIQLHPRPDTPPMEEGTGPWIEPVHGGVWRWIEDAQGRAIALVWSPDAADTEANGDFLVLAANCHDDLVAAARRALHAFEGMGPRSGLYDGVTTTLRTALEPTGAVRTADIIPVRLDAGGFGRRLFHAGIAKGLAPTALSAAAGLDRQAVMSIIRGQRLPNSAELDALRRVVDLDEQDAEARS